uniref:Coiled-coil domain-containing protein 9 n=1 Tax=Eptatretus burgeri TaxID=7764 RepID=A0A8C4Q8J5_EPTBU
MTSVPGSKMPDKDVELDKRMEAIRKKNEAIMKRYAEIQADKQHAEAEGMAIDLKAPPSPSRPPFRGGSQRRSSDEGKRLGGGNWATRDKERQRKDSDEDRKQQEMTHNDPAMRKPKGVPPRQDPQMDYPPVSGRDVRGFRGRGRGRGRGDRSSQPTLQDKRCQEREENRRLNIEKMSEEMEQIADYERGQRDGRSEKNPVRNFLDDSWRSGPISSRGDRRQDSRRHRTNWGGADFEHVKTGMDRQRRQRQDGWARSDGMSSEMHMQLSMTGRERVEYARWKHEREVIDRERLSRHRNAAGEWRREWDANKSENMFRETAGGAETDNADGNVYQDKPRSPRPHNLGAFMSRPQLQNPAGRNRDYSMHDERWRDDTPAPSSEKNEASPGFEVSVPPADDEGESKTNVTQEGDLELSTDKVTEQTEDVSIDTQDKVAE